MRIVIAQRLTLAHGIRGGMEQQAQQLAAGLMKCGHEPLVLTTPHPDGRAAGDEGGVPVRYITPGSWRRYEGRWWAACYSDLRLLHCERPFDLLVSQSGGALGYIPRVRQELGLPVAAVIHGTLNGGLRTLWRSAASLRGIYRLGRLLATLPYHLLLWRRSVPHVARWIAAASQQVADEWRWELGIAPERIVALPSGVDTDRFKPDPAARAATRARLGIPPDASLLLGVGRLEREKGFHLAVAALGAIRRTHPDALLLLAGDGSERRALELQAAATGGAARLLGFTAHSELPGLLAAADLLLMPTLRDEAFPMTVIEALAAGLPVVASVLGGRAAIDDGRTGVLLPVGDGAALAAAATTLLADGPRRKAMGCTARHAAVGRFSAAQMVAAMERVLVAAAETK